MALLPILIVPDPTLRRECAPVEAVDRRVKRLLDDMLETMYAAPGIGLAAPQIGVTERLVVCDVAREDEPAQPLQLINPEVVWASEEKAVANEGCLSLPEQYADVERPAAVKVRYTDPKGETREIACEGLLATCLQHEIDHLNGVLFIDYLSSLKRSMIMKRLAKARRQKASA